MDAWLIWLVVAGVMVGLEVATLTLVLGMAAVGAVAALGVALLGGAAWLQMLVFIVVTLAMLLVVRPVARRHTTTPHELRTGTAALVGQKAQVLDPVDADSGRIRLAGEVWSARSFNPRTVIDRGKHVHVVQIEGATALVVEED